MYRAGGGFIDEARSLAPDDHEVSLEPLIVHGDGEIVAVHAQQLLFQACGERRDTIPLMVLEPRGQNADTIGTWSGLERAFFELPSAGPFTVPIGFARNVFHASSAKGAAIGSSDSLDITVFQESMRPTLRLVGPGGWGGGDGRNEERMEIPRSRAFSIRHSRDIPELRRAWTQAEARETLPGFEGLEMDANGRFSIDEATVPGTQAGRWIVCTPDGIPESAVRLTALRTGYLPGNTELLAVSRGGIAVLRKNTLDEEFVEG